LESNVCKAEVFIRNKAEVASIRSDGE